MVWSCGRPALFDYHLIAVMIADTIKPGIWHLPTHANNQGIAFPMGVGVTHPGIYLRFQVRLIHVENTIRFCYFVGNQDNARGLHYLEWERHVVCPGHAGHITLGHGIIFDCTGTIGIRLPAALFIIRNAAALDDTQSTRRG